jgi:hypothetical protein
MLIHALPALVTLGARARTDLHPHRVTEPHSSPCRACLHDALPGEHVLLFGYSPFLPDATTPYRTFGPVFVHADPAACTPFTTSGTATDALARRLLSVRAHAADGTMLHSDVTPGDALAALADRFLADPAVGELHVHHARAGCFACRVLRAPDHPPMR